VIDNALLRQFFRYAVAGGVAFVIDFAVLTFAVEQLDLHYLVAATAGFVAGCGTCYLVCVTWVFNEHRFDNRLHEAIVFALIGVAALGVNNVTMYILVDFAGVWYAFAKILTAGVVLLFNFGARRVAVFTRTPLVVASGEVAAQVARAK
jgi:putative flippase GtrA